MAFLPVHLRAKVDSWTDGRVTSCPMALLAGLDKNQVRKHSRTEYLPPTCKVRFVRHRQQSSTARWLQGPDGKLEKIMEYQDYSPAKWYAFIRHIQFDEIFILQLARGKRGSLPKPAVNEEQGEKSCPKPCIREDKVIQEKSRSRSTMYDGWQKSWWGIGSRLGNLDPLWRQEKRNWKAPHGQAAGVGFGFTSTIPALVNTILT